MNTNIYGDVQICISVPLSLSDTTIKPVERYACESWEDPKEQNFSSLKYNIGRNVNSDFCIVTMHRVAQLYFLNWD